VGAVERSHEAVVRGIFDAFARKEGFALRGLFAEDATWSVPGRGIMAGTYRGRDEIFRFLAQLLKETDGTYGSELVDVLTSDTRPHAPRAGHGAGGRRARPGLLADSPTRVLALPS
jgi:ketosteroid isomerase-like protein